MRTQLLVPQRGCAFDEGLPGCLLVYQQSVQLCFMVHPRSMVSGLASRIADLRAIRTKGTFLQRWTARHSVGLKSCSGRWLDL